MTDPDDALARLREQVRAAHETAQRVAEQAAATPPAGFAVPDEPPPGRENPEVQALVALIELVRSLVPADLQAQLAELVRELLLLVRTLIDLVVGRLERRSAPPVEVEDIPIG